MAENMYHECECGLYSGQRGYDKSWLRGTFSQAMFVGNGQLGILERLPDAHAGRRAVARGQWHPLIK